MKQNTQKTHKKIKKNQTNKNNNQPKKNKPNQSKKQTKTKQTMKQTKQNQTRNKYCIPLCKQETEGRQHAHMIATLTTKAPAFFCSFTKILADS